jgi:hypothetical protein
MASKKQTLRNKRKTLRNKRKTLRNKKRIRKTKGGLAKKQIFKVRVDITKSAGKKGNVTHITTMNSKDTLADVLSEVENYITRLPIGIKELQDPKSAMGEKTGTQRFVKEYIINAEEPAAEKMAN